MKISYGKSILSAFDYLLSNHPDVFVIGQGLWSPWYVGTTMTDLDVKFGKERIIDTPVSESACTGAAVGASLAGMRPIIVHPRMDFMLYAMDAIVNQAAKWSHMFGGQAHPGVTIRAIINRGGEQGAQHSQALHAWFAHTPGLRVVMPSTPKDARDLLISSVLCPDPVLYIDDRWLYDIEDEIGDIQSTKLNDVEPNVLIKGSDVTIVGIGYTTKLAVDSHALLLKQNIDAEIIDLRVLNPFNVGKIINSVEKTGHLIVVDGGWKTCGVAGEVIASVSEALNIGTFRSAPTRITLPDAPAPTASNLESEYYIDSSRLTQKVLNILK